MDKKTPKKQRPLTAKESAKSSRLGFAVSVNHYPYNRQVAALPARLKLAMIKAELPSDKIISLGWARTDHLAAVLGGTALPDALFLYHLAKASGRSMEWFFGGPTKSPGADNHFTKEMRQRRLQMNRVDDTKPLDFKAYVAANGGGK